MKTLTPKKMAKKEDEILEEPKKTKLTIVWVIILGILQTITTVGFNIEGLYVFLASLILGFAIAFYFEYLQHS